MFSWSLFHWGREYLLYDFNLHTGSVTPPDSLLYKGINVISTDSVALSNGSYIKKYNDSIFGYWLSGIGSSYGFLPDLYYRLAHFGPGPSPGGHEMSLCYENPSFSYKFQFTTQVLDGNLQNNCFDLSTMVH